MKKTGIVFLMLIMVLSLVSLTGCFNSNGDKDIYEIVDPNNSTGQSQQETPQNEVEIGTGTYIGQIDSNSVEIHISGVPEDMASRAFRFSQELRDVFDQQGIKDNTSVKFEYYVNSQDQWVLEKIDPM